MSSMDYIPSYSFLLHPVECLVSFPTGDIDIHIYGNVQEVLMLLEPRAVLVARGLGRRLSRDGHRCSRLQ